MESPIEQTSTTQTSLKPKQKFEGKVMKTSLQGAIIDIGEKVPGFLHISQVVNVVAPDAVVKNLEDIIKSWRLGQCLGATRAQGPCGTDHARTSRPGMARNCA